MVHLGIITTESSCTTHRTNAALETVKQLAYVNAPIGIGAAAQLVIIIHMHVRARHYKDGMVSKGYSFPVRKGIWRVRERYVKGRIDELVVAQRQ